MSLRGRVILAALWALSLVVVSGWRAQAQMVPAPGGEVRFIQSGSANGVLTGQLMANLNGSWVVVDIDRVRQPGIVPLGHK